MAYSESAVRIRVRITVRVRVRFRARIRIKLGLGSRLGLGLGLDSVRGCTISHKMKYLPHSKCRPLAKLRQSAAKR